MSESFDTTPSLVQPKTIATLGLLYAAVNLIVGLLLVFVDLSGTWQANVARILSVAGVSAMVAAISGLTLSIHHFVTVLRDVILPRLR